MKILRAALPVKCDEQANQLGEALRREVRRNVVAAQNQAQHMDRVGENMSAILSEMKTAIEKDDAR